MLNHKELFLILTLRFEAPLADAPTGASCLATYIMQGFLDHIGFILGGLMVGLRYFHLAFEACPGLYETLIHSPLLPKLDAQVSHPAVGVYKCFSEVIQFPA